MKKSLFAAALFFCAAGALAGPDPSLGEQGASFDRLTGNWDVDYVFYGKNGSVKRNRGDFAIDWVMEGRVQQCLYTIDRTADHKEKYIGTSLSYFHPKSQTWRMVYVDPEVDATLQMTGGAEGKDRIVMLSNEENGKVDRWSFNDIRQDSFIYRDETSTDGGKSWHLNEEDHMTRQAK